MRSADEQGLTMSATGLVIVIVAIILGIYDLTCVAFGRVSSVSQFIVANTHASPVLTFCFGVLVGHLFCNMYPDTTEKK